MSSKESFPLIILSLINPKMFSVCDKCTVKMVKNISDSFYTFSTNIEPPRNYFKERNGFCKQQR